MQRIRKKAPSMAGIPHNQIPLKEAMVVMATDKAMDSLQAVTGKVAIRNKAVTVKTKVVTDEVTTDKTKTSKDAFPLKSQKDR